MLRNPDCSTWMRRPDTAGNLHELSSDAQKVHRFVDPLLDMVMTPVELSDASVATGKLMLTKVQRLSTTVAAAPAEMVIGVVVGIDGLKSSNRTLSTIMEDITACWWNERAVAAKIESETRSSVQFVPGASIRTAVTARLGDKFEKRMPRIHT